MNDPRLESIDADLATLAEIRAAIAKALADPNYRSPEQLKAEITRLEAALAECRGEQVPSEPPDEPTRDWRTVQVNERRSDWKSTLISIPGATLIDSTLPSTDTPALRYYVPQGDHGGDSRCEVQEQPAGLEGEWRAYEWGLWVPRSFVVPTAYNQPTVVSQHHGNNQAGYGGGTSLDRDNTLWARIRGGHELSLSGSHDYEYEKDAAIGQIQRDRLHTIRLEILWHREHGEYRALLDGKLGVNLTDIPTWPLGDKDGDPTDNIMWRLGLYPQGGRVAGPMEMWTTPCKFEVAAS